MSSLGVAVPFWLDRPDDEAVEIALAAQEAGLEAVWVGEMASFDAFALATAIGTRTERIALKIGPLAVSVRSPVALALGIYSVKTLTGARSVGLALGASSPTIVAGWHDRAWSALPVRTRETIEALRILFAGGRLTLDGEQVRSHGFKLRSPLPDTTITVAAFGPAMTSVAARHADEVVLNLVSVDHVARVRTHLGEKANRPRPRLAVWVPAALDPGAAALRQLAGQLAVYLGAPGYGEMFAALGYAELVQRARAGERRAQLAEAVPLDLLAQIGAVGGRAEVRARIAEYHAAGADEVAIVPSTAEDPAGRRVLAAASMDV